jgi:hypothetical protein
VHASPTVVGSRVQSEVGEAGGRRRGRSHIASRSSAPLLVAPFVGIRRQAHALGRRGRGGPAVGRRLVAGSGRGATAAEELQGTTVGAHGRRSSAPATTGAHGELPRLRSGGGGGRPPPTGSASTPALDPHHVAGSGLGGGKGRLPSCSDASPSPCSAVLVVEDGQYRDPGCGPGSPLRPGSFASPAQISRAGPDGALRPHPLGKKTAGSTPPLDPPGEGAGGEVGEGERERERESGGGRRRLGCSIPRDARVGASLQNAACFADVARAATVRRARTKCRCSRSCSIR